MATLAGRAALPSWLHSSATRIFLGIPPAILNHREGDSKDGARSVSTALAIALRNAP